MNAEDEIKKTVDEINSERQQSNKEKAKPTKVEKEEFVPMIKSDAMLYDTKYSNFEYIVKKVETLQEEVELMQKILTQNNLKLKMEVSAGNDIETKTWQKLENEM